MSRAKRIEEERKEFNEWKSSISCSGEPKENESVWNIVMQGPKDSPYMGGKFRIRIEFPSEYPTKPPIFKFETPICHINISTSYICLDTLHGKYKQEASIIDLLSQIFMMLTSPNETDALIGEYKNLYINDYSGYLAKAREMTREYAK